MLLQTLFVYISLILVMSICGRSVSHSASRNTTITPKDEGVFLSPAMAFMVLFFSVLVGIRYDVGTDQLHYLVVYESGFTDARYEPLFNLVISACQAAHLHSSFFFGIIALIQITFFYLAFKEEKYLYPFLAIFIFTSGLFGSWTNTLRQDVAGCIWVFAINYIYKKDYKRYLFWCIVAFFFHRSAIILIVLYPLLRIKKDFFTNVPIQIIIVLIAIISKKYIVELFFDIDNLIEQYTKILSIGSDIRNYDAYSSAGIRDDFGGNLDEVSNTGVGTIVKYISYTIIVAYSNRLKQYFNNEKFSGLYMLFYIAFILYIILPIGIYSLSRPFQYFNFTFAAMLSYAAYYWHRGQKNEQIVGIFIIAIQILMYFSAIIIPFFNDANYKGYSFFFQ